LGNRRERGAATGLNFRSGDPFLHSFSFFFWTYSEFLDRDRGAEQVAPGKQACGSTEQEPEQIPDIVQTSHREISDTPEFNGSQKSCQFFKTSFPAQSKQKANECKPTDARVGNNGKLSHLLFKDHAQNVLDLAGLALPRDLGEAVGRKPEMFRRGDDINRGIVLAGVGCYIWTVEVILRE
jgi:hypothetical protein